MYDISRFQLTDMTRLGIELRQLGTGAGSMEGASQRIIQTLHDKLRKPDLAEPACALSRMFITLPFAALEPRQKEFATKLYPGAADSPSLKCLTLMATAGIESEWNSRHKSSGHIALPLPSADSVARSPMIAQLMKQLGVELGTLLASHGSVVVDSEQHSFNVFHVEQAKGSPHIPAQAEFVEPYGVRSVLGFGGLLPTGELYATILFSQTEIPREVASLFKTLALNVKVSLLPYARGRFFE